MVASEQALLTSKQLDILSINTLRTLAIDAVQKANSGHPGAPMGLAPVAYCLWQRFLRYDPADPVWPNRDRFVLSNGHASMLLYATLYLCEVRGVTPEYDSYGDFAVTLDDIKNFRQLDSRTPGHPEEGDGDVVVLLHGWPHTSHSWRHVIPKLSAKYRVIAPDMRGLGDSSRPAAGYDNGAVAGDVIELLDSHGVREFSLVGHDWGGPVAFAATLLARDRVKKLALVDTVLAGDGLSAGSGQGGARWHHLFHRTPDLLKL